MLTIAVISSISMMSLADAKPITNETNLNTSENKKINSEVNPKEMLPDFKVEDYDSKYKGILQLLNQAELSEGEYLGIKRVLETQAEYPSLEVGILYFTVLHEKDDPDYKKAIYWLSTSSVDEKNSTADLILGSVYLEGKGVDKDFQKAMSLYQRAAERNNEDAKLILAGTYLFNSYVKNDIKGNYWLDDLVRNNNKYAILLKSLMDNESQNNKEYIKFIEPYFSYAKEGDELAQFTLGYLYHSGKLLGKDIEESNAYLKQSSLQGNPIAIILYQETLKELKNEQKK